MGGIADGIGKLFGNKDAIQKFVDFTKLDVDPDKAEKLASAFAKYAYAMGGAAGGTGVKPLFGPSGGAPSGGAPAPAGGGGGGTSAAIS